MLRVLLRFQVGALNLFGYGKPFLLVHSSSCVVNKSVQERMNILMSNLCFTSIWNVRVIKLTCCAGQCRVSISSSDWCWWNSNHCTLRDPKSATDHAIAAIKSIFDGLKGGYSHHVMRVKILQRRFPTSIRRTRRSLGILSRKRLLRCYQEYPCERGIFGTPRVRKNCTEGFRKLPKTPTISKITEDTEVYPKIAEEQVEDFQGLPNFNQNARQLWIMFYLVIKII